MNDLDFQEERDKQFVKLQFYMFKHHEKRVPLCDCETALDKAENEILSNVDVGTDLCIYAGQVIMRAIEILKNNKPRLDS